MTQIQSQRQEQLDEVHGQKDWDDGKAHKEIDEYVKAEIPILMEMKELPLKSREHSTCESINSSIILEYIFQIYFYQPL